MGSALKKPDASSAGGASKNGVVLRRLRRGELLFAEGEHSRAMYLIRTGMIRLYKKKGDSQIELDTARSGQILGELAFLDGNPRSASGEALTDCELVEISGAAFTDVLRKMPDWLKIMLKTIVGRLRTSSTKIRQLEQASTSFDYSGKDGKRSAHYVYLSPHDILKVFTAILLVGARHGVESEDGIEVRLTLLTRYGNQIMGVPVAKITTLMDVLSQVGIIEISEDSTQYFLREMDFLENLVVYLNEENLLDPTKRHDLSLRGFLVMSLIAKHMNEYPAEKDSGYSEVNIAQILKAEAASSGREPFRLEDFPELVEIGYATNLNVQGDDSALTTVHAKEFIRNYRFQRVIKAIEAVNEEKRKSVK